MGGGGGGLYQRINLEMICEPILYFTNLSVAHIILLEVAHFSLLHNMF